MANSIRNVTVPLQSTLNMNRNQSLTTSSYDIFNSLNAPVFGGCISPLHYKYASVGDAKYSRDGTKWSIVENILYKDDLLFKNFTGEYAFDMVDTKLDLDGLVYYSGYYVGFKLKTNTLDWCKVNQNFQIEASGIVETITSPESIDTAKIVVRDNQVLIFYKQKELDKDDNLWDSIAVKVWNGNGFTTGASAKYVAEKQTSSNSVTSIVAKEYQATASTQSLITVSQSFNGQVGVSVFNDRPKGTNAFKNVYVANFLFNTDGTSSTGQISLRSGKDIAPVISVDGSSYSARANISNVRKTIFPSN